MKFFSTVFAVGLLLAQSTYVNAVECGEGRVQASGKGVCIQPDYIEGCASYVDVSQCFECKSSYVLRNRKCDYVGGLSSGVSIPGCLTTDALDKCTNCANGFRRINGTCKFGVKNCGKYNDKDQCIDCDNDYSLVFGKCRHNYLLGCRIQSQEHSCKQCFAPFKMNGNHCDIAHCKSYNDFGCVGCECGYYLTANRVCKQMTSGCIQYSREMCSNCLSHYKLVGGTCQIDGCLSYQGSNCEKCDEKYTLKEGGCSFNNCEDWMNGKCIVCKNGFKRQNDQCVQMTSQQLKCM